MREFANQKALIDYAEQNGLAYLWEGMPAFAKRQRAAARLRQTSTSTIDGSIRDCGCAHVPWRAAGDAVSEGDLGSRVGRRPVSRGAGDQA